MLRATSLFAIAAVLSGCQMNSDAQTSTKVASTSDVTLQTQPTAISLARIAQAKAQGGSKGGNRILSILEKSLKDDPSLIANRLTVASSQASLDRTRDWFRPEVTTTAQKLSSSEGTAALTVTQPLFDFGKRNARVAKAEQQIKNDGISIKQSQAQLAFQILKTAIDARQARAETTLNNRRITAFSKALQQAQQLSDLNLLSGVDKQLAQVRLEQAKKDRRTADIQLTQATANWRRLTGLASTPPSVSIVGDLNRRFGLATLSKAKSTARAHNLNVSAARAVRVLLERTIDVQRTGSRPTLSAVGTTRLGSVDGKRSDIGISLEYPIFSRDSRDALADLESGLVVKDAEIAELQRQLGFEIDELWQQISGSREISNLENQSVAALADRADQLEVQLESGLIPFSDVVAAKTELFSTEAAALDSKFTAERAALDLLILSGAVTAN